MARETNQRWRTLEGVVLVGGVLSAVAAYTYYSEQRRRGADARVVCERCGDTLPVTDVLNPSVTCSCVPTGRTNSEFH